MERRTLRDPAGSSSGQQTTFEALTVLVCMARYFFNIDGVSRSPDEEGEELPNNDAAWNEATVIAGELFRNNDGKFRPGEEWALEVADDHRRSDKVAKNHG